MSWLTVILHLFTGATLSGVGIVAALVMGYDSLPALGGAAIGGFVLAFPVSMAVARGLTNGQDGQ